MRKLIFAIPLIILFSASSQGAVIKTTRSMWGKEATVYRCELLTKAVSLFVVREKSQKIHSDHLSASVGRWQRFMWMMKPGCSLGEPTSIRTVKTPDQAAMAEIVLPVFKNGVEKGAFTVQAMQLPQFPNWIFFQQKSSKLEIGPGMYLGVVMQWQSPTKKVPRILYSAWPGGSAATGEPVEWFKTRPKFNAIAWYSRGDKEDTPSDYMVFDPKQFKPIHGVRWKKGDDRACFNFNAIGKKIVFALGHNLRKDEDSKTISVPRFFKEESGKVLEAMKKINWETRTDWKALRQKLAEVKKMLEQTPNAELEKECNAISKALKTAAAKGDNAKGVSLGEKIKELKKKVAKAGLESLF